MCDPSDVKVWGRWTALGRGHKTESLAHGAELSNNASPPPPSALARLTCVSILVGIFAVWAKHSFVNESAIPGAHVPLHGWQFPASMNVAYLLSLPLLRVFSNNFLSKYTDVKLLLRESMILYNAAQVLLNGWMVYRFMRALVFDGHPFVGGFKDIVDTGAYYSVWIHYCDKYLEYLDTYFMVLRGRMDQVSSATTICCLSRPAYAHTTLIRSHSFMCIITHLYPLPGGGESKCFPGETLTLARC